MKEWCSVDCGVATARKRQEKAVERQRQQWSREAREYRRAERARRLNIKSKEGSAQAAQRAVNEFILVRDRGKPCIVHGYGCPNADKGWHAGHFQGVGRKPELRYNTWNIHLQCSVSNSGAQQKKYYRNSIEAMYEEELTARIGADRVAWLKGPHPPKQYREDDFKRIISLFKRRTRHYKKLRGIE